MARLKAPQRREQLLDVATKLFARNGYEATTTAAIAEAAGVTEPILYRHFKGKQDLFVAIVRNMSERMVEHWQSLAATISDPEEQIRAISEEFPSHVRALADAYHVIHGAMVTSHDKKVLAVLKEHYARMETFFAQVIGHGQRAGVFRHDLDPNVAAWQLIMTGMGYAMINLNLSPLSAALTGQAIEMIVRGLRA